MFAHFGQVTIKDVEDYVTNITRAAPGGIIVAGMHDKDGLRIGGAFVRGSLGASLVDRVASICSLESSGMLLLKVV